MANEQPTGTNLLNAPSHSKAHRVWAWDGSAPNESFIVCGSINTNISSIGANNRTLVIADNQTLTANLTIPTNVHLHFNQGGKITLGSYNLTINGSLTAPLAQIFDDSGSGTVTFGAGYVKELYAEWWGIDGTADHTEINKAITAATNVKKVKLLGKTYTITDSISLADNITFSGVGAGTIILETTHSPMGR